MIKLISGVWGSFLAPMLGRPKHLQMAALCYRGTGDSKEVLLVTSRGTGRWIIPKGWPIRGLNSPEVALREAWEEAGVLKGKSDAQPVGTYTYDKQLDSGVALPVETLVYPVSVEAMRDNFPESHERKRMWVRLSDAANMIHEPELKTILRHF